MGNFLANVLFLNPWLLTGFIALPLLWLLLRIMPPAPKKITLPTVRFLKGLVPEVQTPSHTPWWILLLRMVTAALVLAALAQPVFNPAGQLAGSGPVRIVLDNSWAAGSTWNTQIQAAQEIVAQAGREKRDVYILTTARTQDNELPAAHGPLSQGDASSILRGLTPLPWPADYDAAAQQSEAQNAEDVISFWLSHGLDEGAIHDLSKALRKQGDLVYHTPDAADAPLLIRLPEKISTDLKVEVLAPVTIPEGLPVSVQALAQDGRVLDRQDLSLDPKDLPGEVTFDIPETLRNEVTQYKVFGRQGSGAVFLLDDRHRKRTVGIAAPQEKAESAPLAEAGYYLKRALEPYAALVMGDVKEIIKQQPSMIVLPDVDALPPDTLNELEQWVRGGGLLLRFAGPNMTRAQGETYLVPVPLRKGGRALDGSLTWENPQKLAPFPENSPFYGLTTSEEVTVRQQVLAEPVEDIDERSWARLTDGTPLITAAPLDHGMLVLVHTSATPQWSDLAVSGLYVEILRRLVSISGSAMSQVSSTGGFLDPLVVLDGFGAVHEPSGSVRPVAATDFGKTVPAPDHPPGIYGRSGYQQALNMGTMIRHLRAAVDFPAGTAVQPYGGEYEHNLMPMLLTMALALLFIDWSIMIVIAAGSRYFWRFAAAILILLPATAHAEPADDVRYADDLYLAYVLTGNAGLDAQSYNGLDALSDVLHRRTSVEPAGVVGVNPEVDELAFFPILYWPVSADQTALSETALTNIQNYLDHGGTILFDTRDQNFTSGALTGTRNTDALRRMIGALNIPPLIPIPEDHVLGKSFYLIDSYPGRYSEGTLWVEQQSANGRDNVSSVIIGSHDWAGAWAAGRGERTAMAGGSRQQEMALRFGVNLVVYALTGNYKADQVHVPYILERLGQ
jgi:hypothetical protein